MAEVKMNYEDLVRVLRGHDIAVDNASLKAAWDDEEQGRALSEWADLHLTPDTLLSADELNLYAALEKSGKADRLAETAGYSSTLFFSDDDIKVAIEELARSTEAISKQTEALRQQQDALKRLVGSSSKGGESRSSLESKRLAKWETDRKALTSVVENMSHGLEFRISDMEQQTKGLGVGLRQTVDSLFQSDDKLLSSLQKLGWELETEDPEEQESIRKLRDICARLIKYTVEAIRTKLDRVYLEALESSQRSGDRSRVSQDDMALLQEEVESLYSEILPVAQMSVEQQYLEPALKSLAAKNGESQSRSAAAVTYIHSCFDYLLEHIEVLSARIEAFKGHQAATSTVLATAKTEVSVTIQSPSKIRRRPTVNASPTRRRKSSGHGGSPVRTRTMSTPRRRSSGGLDEPPLEQLLRGLALSLPQPDDGTAPATAALDREQLAFLSRTLGERSAKAADVARNAQEAFEGAAAAQLADARRALQAVRDSVLAESARGDVRLVDSEIDGSIAVLAQEVARVQSQLQGVERDVAAVRKRSAKKEELVGRWSR